MIKSINVEEFRTRFYSIILDNSLWNTFYTISEAMVMTPCTYAVFIDIKLVIHRKCKEDNNE